METGTGTFEATAALNKVMPDHWAASRPASVNSSVVYFLGRLQFSQTTRTNRWAMMQFSADTKLYGSDTMLIKRPIYVGDVVGVNGGENQVP